jgi:hypothetical protein
MSTFHLPPTHCSVVLMSDYVIVACLSSRTVLVSLHVPMYSQCRHTHTVCCAAPLCPYTFNRMYHLSPRLCCPSSLTFDTHNTADSFIQDTQLAPHPAYQPSSSPPVCRHQKRNWGYQEKKAVQPYRHLLPIPPRPHLTHCCQQRLVPPTQPCCCREQPRHADRPQPHLPRHHLPTDSIHSCSYAGRMQHPWPLPADAGQCPRCFGQLPHLKPARVLSDDFAQLLGC